MLPLIVASIINQSNNKRVYETLRENNETLKENNDLLKRLLKKVVQNDKSVRRHSLDEHSQSTTIATDDAFSDSKSERISQFLADVESVLSSTPSSTPRISVASKEALGGDEELQSIRASFYELGSKSPDPATENHQGDLPDVEVTGDGKNQGLEEPFQGQGTMSRAAPDLRFTGALEAARTPKTISPSFQSSNKTPPPMPWSRVPYHGSLKRTNSPLNLESYLSFLESANPIASDLSLGSFEEQINAALKDADEAPSEIGLLRSFAKRSPTSAHYMITSYYQYECANESNSKSSWTPIFVALALGKLNTAMQLRNKGAIIDRFTNRQGALPSALQLAVLCRDRAAVLWLLNEGVDIDAKGSSDRTPLQNAMLADNIGMMELLLNKGARVLAKDKHHMSIIDLAKEYEKPATLQILLLAISSCKDSRDRKRTLLHYAAWVEDTRAIQWCIRGGSDVNARDAVLQTPLHLATKGLMRGNAGTKAVDLLLANGADPTCQDCNKKAPMHYASDLAHWDTFRLLRDAEADINAKNEDQLTPTHILFPEDVR